MIRGQRAGEVFEKGLDTYLATVADHGFNASTFTARVVASTHAGLISAVLAGLCALKGPLHGGAPGPVLDMLDEIGEASRAEAWFDDAFGKNTTLMGFGHRIYKVRDPRADVLKEAVAKLPETAGRLAYASEVEQGAIAALRRHKPGRRLDTNVEYYTALLLEALEIPREAFTALFAVGRAAGWCAHVFEQEKGGRIIRPQSNYVGARPSIGREPDRRPAPGPGAGPVGVEHPDDQVGAGRGEAQVDVAPPEAAVGEGEQRFGAERVGLQGHGRDPRLGPRLGGDEPGHAGHHRAEAQGLAIERRLHRAAVDAQPHRHAAILGAEDEIDREGREVVGIDMRPGGRRIDVLERDRAIEAHGAGIAAEPFRPQAGLGARRCGEG